MPRLFSLSKSPTLPVTITNSSGSNNRFLSDLFSSKKRLFIYCLVICSIIFFYYQFFVLYHSVEPIPKEEEEENNDLLILQQDNNDEESNNNHNEKPIKLDKEQVPGFLDYEPESNKENIEWKAPNNAKEINLPLYFNNNEKVDESKVWLMIAIPTIPRNTPQHLNIDYFTPTLKSYDLEIERTPFLSKLLKIKLINMRHDQKFELFEKLKAEYKDKTYINTKRKVWEFTEKDTSTVQYKPNGPPITISEKVIRQTSDVIHFLKMNHKKSKYLFIAEDDFLVCDSTLKTVVHLIHKANKRYTKEGWFVMRFSSGLNGLIFHNDNDDVLTFANYLEKRIGKRPPDHIFAEFAARETPEAKDYVGNRYLLAYRYNLLHHLGKVSTLRNEMHYDMPKCWEQLLYPVSFEVEAFSVKQCPNDDLWPCTDRPNEANHQGRELVKVDTVGSNEVFPPLKPLELGSDALKPK
ncbi:hypothetical protein ABK040_005552 [Willaertia magna]